MRLRKYIAEGIGTFGLIFAGCGAAMVDAQTHALGHGGVAAAFGLAVFTMISAVGHISGAHFNPTVTCAFALTGRLAWREVPAYVTSQSIAGLLAAGLLSATLGDLHPATTTPTGGAMQSLIVESVLSFALMFVIMAVATDHRAVGHLAAPAIGGTVLLAALFGGPISGASLNPVRTLAPGWIADDLTAAWIYLVGPMAGAALGGLAYHFVRCDPQASGPAGGCC